MASVRRNGSEPFDSLIGTLAADLKPVRPLSSPWLRAAGWIAAVAALAIVFALFADTAAMWLRLSSAPDLWLSAAGSALTAILSALAAFQLDLPDRSQAWVLLPLPALVLWVGASGIGCLRTWLVPNAQEAQFGEGKDCLMIIVGLSIPLSALLVAMLRRGYAMQPTLTGAVGGLAVAAAAATLLNFVHPFDATATDLAMHALAVVIVVLANRTLGGRLLRREKIPQPA